MIARIRRDLLDEIATGTAMIAAIGLPLAGMPAGTIDEMTDGPLLPGAMIASLETRYRLLATSVPATIPTEISQTLVTCSPILASCPAMACTLP